MQERLRSLVPPPQVLPQGDQEFQPLQPPCTTKMKNFQIYRPIALYRPYPWTNGNRMVITNEKMCALQWQIQGRVPGGRPPYF